MTEIKMRTKPVGGEWMSLGKDRTRNSASILGYNSYWMPPGTYTVNLTAEDESFSEKITVLKDPNSEGTIADITAQTDFMAKLHEDIDNASKMVNELEILRRQLLDLKAALKVQNDDKEIIEALNKLDSLLIGLEGNFMQLNATGTGQDAVRWPTKLIEKMGYLATSTAISDFPPADAYREVYAVLKQRLTNYSTEFDSLMTGEFVTLIELLEENGITPIVRKKE
ncbi:MAG: hypothetical protein GY816_10455 [Cytophagales bacterium]|nr:hypothetical protein [Cytophagales bacterium]